MTISVAVVGAKGRMGKVVSRLVQETEGFELAASIDSSMTLDAALGADLIFDVTVPAVSQSVVEFAIEQGISVVVGTSGWSSERIATLNKPVAEGTWFSSSVSTFTRMRRFCDMLSRL